jgi:hypothetical protein
MAKWQVRACERKPWARFKFVGMSDRVYAMSDKDVCGPMETNAAANATIIIDRMLRDGRVKWRNRLMQSIRRRMDPG